MCVRAPPPLLQLLNRADENVNYIIKNNLYNLGYNYRPRSSSSSLRSLYYARVSYVLLQCHATTCRCNMCRATQVQVHLKVARAVHVTRRSLRPKIVRRAAQSNESESPGISSEAARGSIVLGSVENERTKTKTGFVVAFGPVT